jgi:phospholipid transport system substrate-binding protein
MESIRGDATYWRRENDCPVRGTQRSKENAMIAKSPIRLLLVFVLLASGIAWANEAPDVLVKDVTSQVLNILRHDKGLQSGNRQRAIEVIETIVAPHFDFDRMTRLAVGRAWRQADASQRQKLTAQFRTLLVRTYASALIAYRDQTVSFKPLRKEPSGDEVTVRSQIDKPGAEPITLDYSLAKSGGNWKVFDVAIAGVSLVTNYRDSFASEVERGGIDGLIRSLETKNHHVRARNG